MRIITSLFSVFNNKHHHHYKDSVAFTNNYCFCKCFHGTCFMSAHLTLKINPGANSWMAQEPNNKREQTAITQRHLKKSQMAEQSCSRPGVMHCSHLSHNVIKSSRLEAIKVWERIIISSSLRNKSILYQSLQSQ